MPKPALTPAMVRSLEWFAKKSAPVGWIPIDGPNFTMVKRLCAAGLAVTIYPKGGFGLCTYQITAAGREALDAHNRG